MGGVTRGKSKMKVSELIEVITTDLWITFGEDPNREEPDIILRDASHTTLSGELLEAEVHLMTVVHSNAIFISLNRNGGKQ